MSQDSITYKKFDDIPFLLLSIFLNSYLLITLELNKIGRLTSVSYYFISLFCILTIIPYIFIKIFLPYVDKLIFSIVQFLSFFGIIVIYRIEIDDVSTSFFTSNSFRQSIFLTIGIFLTILLVIFLRDHRFLRKYTYTCMLIGLVLMILPIAPGIGQEINGARLWISFAGFSVQPAEFSKIFITIFFAGYLIDKRDTLALAGKRIWVFNFPRIIDLGPLLLVWIISLGVLVVQKDLGTSLLFMGVFVALLYVSTGKKSWVFIGLILFIAGSFTAFNIFSHLRARVQMWLDAFNPEIYNRPIGGSYQLVQGLFSLGNGGLFGTGIGKGHPSLTPFSESDFIYTNIGEEFGLTGIMAILILYLLLCMRIIRSAIGAKDGFGKLLASGFGFLICLQTFVVIGGITRIIPLTGLTLPFIAKGGSSLVANIIMISITLVISNKCREPIESISHTSTITRIKKVSNQMNPNETRTI